MNYVEQMILNDTKIFVLSGDGTVFWMYVDRNENKWHKLPDLPEEIQPGEFRVPKVEDVKPLEGVKPGYEEVHEERVYSGKGFPASFSK